MMNLFHQFVSPFTKNISIWWRQYVWRWRQVYPSMGCQNRIIKSQIRWSQQLSLISLFLS
ncbi:unnamed protein product [Paramecium primaurelia]|uniref:Uncharacterized protein n=1 Tax=Paramecium primaurelia TaxID=5886 RepID=A0A8S1QXJ0_PARPR|nr:unnamed protein product [Paramecium primaurelia]